MPSRGGPRQKRRIKNAFDIGSQQDNSTNINSSVRGMSGHQRNSEHLHSPDTASKTLNSVHRRGKSLRRKVAQPYAMPSTVNALYATQKPRPVTTNPRRKPGAKRAPRHPYQDDQMRTHQAGFHGIMEKTIEDDTLIEVPLAHQ